MKICFDLFATFIKIGAFTLGGGYVMIPLIENEVVERRRWIQKDDFFDMLTIIQAAPGPIAVNAAVFIGSKVKGFKGAVASLLGVLLPSFLIILLVAHFFSEIRENVIIQRVFYGIRPAVVALILVPAVNLLRKDGFRFKTVLIALLSAIAVGFFAISPILVMIVAGTTGLLVYMYSKRKE